MVSVVRWYYLSGNGITESTHGGADSERGWRRLLHVSMLVIGADEGIENG